MNSETAIKGKADQVMERITAWLKSGKLSVGDKLPSERELSESFGVSLLTVNKAMARLEDAGMLSRSAGRGTHVAKIPANDAIAIVCDIRHIASPDHAPYIDSLIESLFAKSQNCGLNAHFMVGRGESAKDFVASLNLNSSVWQEIKGVIARGWRDGFEERLAEMGIPSVIIGAWNQGRHAVMPDYEELGRIAAATLAQRNARKLCIVHQSDYAEMKWNSPLTAFEELEGKGTAPFATIKVPTKASSPAEGEELARELDSALRDCDSLFITDDNIAAGFSRHFEKSPASMPRLAISHANNGAKLPLHPSFLKISFDVNEMAEEALALLGKLRGAHAGSAPSRSMVKPKLELQ